MKQKKLDQQEKSSEEEFTQSYHEERKRSSNETTGFSSNPVSAPNHLKPVNNKNELVTESNLRSELDKANWLPRFEEINEDASVAQSSKNSNFLTDFEVHEPPAVFIPKTTDSHTVENTRFSDPQTWSIENKDLQEKKFFENAFDIDPTQPSNYFTPHIHNELSKSSLISELQDKLSYNGVSHPVNNFIPPNARLSQPCNDLTPSMHSLLGGVRGIPPSNLVAHDNELQDILPDLIATQSIFHKDSLPSNPKTLFENCFQNGNMMNNLNWQHGSPENGAMYEKVSRNDGLNISSPPFNIQDKPFQSPQGFVPPNFGAEGPKQAGQNNTLFDFSSTAVAWSGQAVIGKKESFHQQNQQSFVQTFSNEWMHNENMAITGKQCNMANVFCTNHSPGNNGVTHHSYRQNSAITPDTPSTPYLYQNSLENGDAVFFSQ